MSWLLQACNPSAVWWYKSVVVSEYICVCSELHLYFLCEKLKLMITWKDTVCQTRKLYVFDATLQLRPEERPSRTPLLSGAAVAAAQWLPAGACGACHPVVFKLRQVTAAIRTWNIGKVRMMNSKQQNFVKPSKFGHFTKLLRLYLFRKTWPEIIKNIISTYQSPALVLESAKTLSLAEKIVWLNF